MAQDGYSAVDFQSPTEDDEELQRQRLQMRAPIAPASDYVAPAPVAAPSMSQDYPAVDSAAASLAPAISPAPRTLQSDYADTVKADPQPTWKDYQPAERHGLAKVGHTLAEMFLPPSVSEAPERRAEQQYAAADKEWNQRRANEAKMTELQQKPELAEETGELRGENAANVARIGAEGRQAVATTTQTGANTREAGKEKTAEDIEKEKTASAEKIAKQRTDSQERVATARDLTSKEVAKIRGDMSNDPNKLTTVMKTMKQQAQTTLPQIDKAMDETEKVATMLGPAEGRWHDFMQGTVGAPDPAFAHYRDEIHMVSTAVTLAHARGRMSNELFESFQKMFDAGAQSSENMMQALSVAKEWLDGYAKMGEEGSPVAPPSSGGANKIPTFAEHQASKKKP